MSWVAVAAAANAIAQISVRWQYATPPSYSSDSSNRKRLALTEQHPTNQISGKETVSLYDRLLEAASCSTCGLSFIMQGVADPGRRCGGYPWQEAHSPQPSGPPDLLRHRAAAAAIVCGTLMRCTVPLHSFCLWTQNICAGLSQSAPLIVLHRLSFWRAAHALWHLMAPADGTVPRSRPPQTEHPNRCWRAGGCHPGGLQNTDAAVPGQPPGAAGVWRGRHRHHVQLAQDGGPDQRGRQSSLSCQTCRLQPFMFRMGWAHTPAALTDQLVCNAAATA